MKPNNENIINIQNFFDINTFQIIQEYKILNSIKLIPKEDIHLLEQDKYIIVVFPNIHKTYILSWNKAMAFPYIKSLIEINNNSSCLEVTSVKKIDEYRYFITIPDFFYSNISDYIFENHLKYIFRDGIFQYGTDYHKNIHIMKCIIEFINCLGGIDENQFLFYRNYVKMYELLIEKQNEMKLTNLQDNNFI